MDNKIVSNVLSRIPAILLICNIFLDKVWLNQLALVMIIVYCIYEIVLTYQGKRRKFYYAMNGLLIVICLVCFILYG